MGYGSKSIDDWARDVHKLAREKGWWTPYEAREGALRELSADQLLGKLMLAVSELAEACEEVRRPDFVPRKIYLTGGGENKKPEGFGIELADCVIRIFDLAKACGIDIEQCVRDKHYYNETRPQRHGNKRA
jgi:NTP pyrophosphatase (non-canonical NTP hydrolase)